MLSRRGFLKLSIAGGAATYVATRGGFMQVGKAAQSPQTPLPGSAIPQFIDPLPNLLDGNTLIVDDGSMISLSMEERLVNVLPAGAVPNYAGTYVWSYIKAGQEGRGSYLGPVIVAKPGSPTTIKFANNLGNVNGTNVQAYKYSTDQTLHWADPNDTMYAHMVGYPAPGDPRAQNYDGSIPAVPHLHGGYVPPVLDGGPDAWFTSDGVYHGTGYYSAPGALPNECIYRYLNEQEPSLIWFHDHTLGATRLNVYCGLAGGYLLTDLASDTIVNGYLNNGSLVPLVIQDRMFDTDGQWFFPAATSGGVLWALNPEHPYWVPEFIGDAICVNGKTWPYYDVKEQRYLFMMINGSNARSYELQLIDPVSKNMGPALWVIATDGGYLDTAAKIDPRNLINNKLVTMPGERYWIIIDFAGFAAGVIGPNGLPYSGRWILKNTAKAPYPGGESPNGATTGRIMQFRVTAGTVPDPTFNPATTPTLRTPMVRLAQATINQRRLLTLNEIMGMPISANDPVSGDPVAYPGGPMEILVNNTKWSGKRIKRVDPNNPMMFEFEIRDDFTLDQNGINWLSEIPKEGDTELWTIVNLTADAHPIHTHLVQFQLVNRRNFDVKKYAKVYAAAFGGGFDYTMRPMGMQVGAGVFIPAFGPPLNYKTGNPAALGGNPDVTPFLQGPEKPPLDQENGWKDTIMVPPGMVTTFLVRWAPQDISASTPSDECHLPFDPRALGGGYVWHCHIVDHEDNEMMRPDEVEPNYPEIKRKYRQGIDY